MYCKILSNIISPIFSLAVQLVVNARNIQVSNIEANVWLFSLLSFSFFNAVLEFVLKCHGGLRRYSGI